MYKPSDGSTPKYEGTDDALWAIDQARESKREVSAYAARDELCHLFGISNAQLLHKRENKFTRDILKDQSTSNIWYHGELFTKDAVVCCYTIEWENGNIARHTDTIPFSELSEEEAVEFWLVADNPQTA